MCNLCGKPMVIKKSRFGPFLGCSGYPECTNTRRIGKDGKPVPLPEPTGVTCPKCQQGELMQRRGKFGRPFFGCNRYPKCDYLVNDLAEVAQYVPGAAPSAPQPAKAAKAAPSAGRATANSSAPKKPAAAAKAGSASRNGSAKKPSATAKRPAAKKATGGARAATRRTGS
jgi:DNA topoisomerase-1